MAIDLISELRASALPGTHVGDCMIRAADEIERLRSEVRDWEIASAEQIGALTPNEAQVLRKST